MVTGAAIKKIAYYLPEERLDNRAIERMFPGWSSEKIEEKVGIRTRHLAAPDETALDMAAKASEQLLAHVDREKIDFLIFCTQSPDYFLPTSACILQDRLKLKTGIGAFDMNLGCSGFIYGLMTGAGMIKSGMVDSLLFVTAETYSKHIHPKDRGNRIIFGDGAAATLIEKSDTDAIGAFALGTNGKGYANLIVKNGGLKKRFEPNALETEDQNGCTRTDNHLFMNGPEIFNFTIETIPKLVKELLEKNRVTMDEIDYVVFHQANKYILDYLRKKLKIPKEKFHIDLENTGNTVSSTIPIALADSLERGTIQKGSRVLLAGFGVGYSWGGTVVRI